MTDEPTSAPEGSLSLETFARDIEATAIAMADAARTITLSLFRSPELSTDNKLETGFDPVTEADRAAERAMREVLAQRRPLDAIRGEEYGSTPGTSGFTWVLDPIDGTRAYLSGLPCWGTLIALCSEDGPVHGIIDQPFTGERWQGGPLVARHSSPHGDRDLCSRAPRPIGEAILFSTFPEIGTAQDRARFQRVSEAVRLTRYGTDCYAYGLLALGQIDLVIEAGLNDYDICGPIAVIEAAGGIVTNWEGGPAHKGGRVIAAANDAIHAEALELLS
ncbi:inositol monophosphatase family protein [Tropicimonas sp. TH_r6]|uniref:inositol monophosphatase family protein n=1 Tax=Tropicimonas sp. TH_r6 TaxID=3082085 RepID=UPI0029556E66|nr:inositol monophosphatase family protein [Tropicimonas sp. TH_r6]MDV7143318.1 inositol monophosphatase family protein [Tropicimonas sp. TH_r6]